MGKAKTNEDESQAKQRSKGPRDFNH